MIECPKNKLPLYTEFPDSTLEPLEALLSGKSGRHFRRMPKYQRAVALERELGLLKPEERLWLHLETMNWEWGKLRDRDAFVRDFAAIVDAAPVSETESGNGETLSPLEHSFYITASAYNLARAGLTEEARAQLRSQPTLGTDDPELDYVRLYRDRVVVCIDAGLKTKACTPDTPIRVR